MHMLNGRSACGQRQGRKEAPTRDQSSDRISAARIDRGGRSLATLCARVTRGAGTAIPQRTAEYQVEPWHHAAPYVDTEPLHHVDDIRCSRGFQPARRAHRDLLILPAAITSRSQVGLSLTYRNSFQPLCSGDAAIRGRLVVIQTSIAPLPSYNQHCLDCCAEQSAAAPGQKRR